MAGKKYRPDIDDKDLTMVDKFIGQITKPTVDKDERGETIFPQDQYLADKAQANREEKAEAERQRRIREKMDQRGGK